MNKSCFLFSKIIFKKIKRFIDITGHDLLHIIMYLLTPNSKLYIGLLATNTYFPLSHKKYKMIRIK